MKRTVRSRGGIIPRIFLFLSLAAILVELGDYFDILAFADRAAVADFVRTEFETKNQIKEIDTGELAKAPKTTPVYTAPAYTAPAYVTPAYVAPRNYMSIMGRQIEIVTTNTTATTPETQIARFVGKNRPDKYPGVFYFGHNTADLLGGLANMPVGSTFSITLDGVTRNYKIMINQTVPNDQKLDDLMETEVARAIHNGVQYSVSLMTCAGQPLPGRNATHRTIVYANEI